MEHVSSEMKMNQMKKTPKRKSSSSGLDLEQRESQINALLKEIDGLFGFYKEVMDRKLNLNLGDCGSINSAVALLLEESKLPLSTLVTEVYEKVKSMGNEMGDGVTVARIKSSILFVGQRVMYGVLNPDADVLENDTDSCLWCWETRDVKLMPQSLRGALKIRRIFREKIHDRITAVYALITALRKSENERDHSSDLIKVSEKRLLKLLSEGDIRLLVNNMIQKNAADMAVKEVKKEEKLLIKQLEKNKREAIKEERRMGRESEKETCRSRNEQKRIKEDLGKDRRREKEESELKKQLKKQQEEAAIRKQLSVMKQASIMERFLKRNKIDSSSPNDQPLTKVSTQTSSIKMSDKMPNAVILSMDSALSSTIEINSADLFRSHLSLWHQLGRSIRSNRKQHWGIRHKPKIELFKEIKLITSKEVDHDDKSSVEKLVDGWGEKHVHRLSPTNIDGPVPDLKRKRNRQLLQFHQTNRPAFYGIWAKKSHVVGPRYPFRKDPDLEYDIDCDEEWEEEEPGESLSDCDKEDDEENLEEECLKDDEDENEDGFFVPDGYLSENEGVQIDSPETHGDEIINSSSNKQGLESEEFSVLLRRKKYLHNLTEHALRKSQPLVILNLMHEKAKLLMAEDLSGTLTLEQTCLQALSICAFPSGKPIEISILDCRQDEDQEACTSNSKGFTSPLSAVTAIQDSELRTIVHAIQSHSQGINKVIDSLIEKFPNTPKSQLKRKVREIADFTDNHWQVKKDILDKLGTSASPEKGVERRKGITSFFSKRCLPPGEKSINPNETSPQLFSKRGSSIQGQQEHACN